MSDFVEVLDVHLHMAPCELKADLTTGAIL